jgi:hypothetical protein
MKLKQASFCPISSGGKTPLCVNNPFKNMLAAAVAVYPVVRAIEDVFVMVQNSSYKK